jgi:hypothetical protein
MAHLALHDPDFYNYEHQAVELPLGEEGIQQLTTEMVHCDEFPDERQDRCKLLIKNLSQAGDAIETSKAKTREWLGLSYTANEEGSNDWKILVAVTMAGTAQDGRHRFATHRAFKSRLGSDERRHSRSLYLI